jgi:hypothetical protein
MPSSRRHPATDLWNRGLAPAELSGRHGNDNWEYRLREHHESPDESACDLSLRTTLGDVLLHLGRAHL